MPRLVVFVEGKAEQRLLEPLLHRHFPEAPPPLVIAHDGKQDLERRLPTRLSAWNIPGDRFMVLRDRDGADCIAVRKNLQQLCRKAGKPETVVRIACDNLEAWYLGDLATLGKIYGKPLAQHQDKEKFRNPDELGNPTQEVQRLVPQFGKVTGASLMGGQMTRDGNRSPSFRKFWQGVDRLLAE